MSIVANRTFFYKCLKLSKILACLALSISFLPATSKAQLCTSATSGVTLGFAPAPDEPEGPPNCLGIWWCKGAQFLGTSYETIPAGCDPSQGPCGVRARVDTKIEGLERNLTASTPLPDTARFTWRSGGNFVGSCGGLGLVIGHDRGDAWIQLGGFQCGATPSSLYTSYDLEVWTCPNATFCPQPMVSTAVNLTPATVAAQLCPPIPTYSCPDDASCEMCKGAAGGASVAGGGAGLTAPASGPSSNLRYLAGGAGFASLPGSASTPPELGPGWSHDYASRIITDPDESNIWLITPAATFRNFKDGDLDGTYTVGAPSDEYRQMRKTATGWELEELEELDGAIHEFDAAGRWRSTTDRHGNTTSATYSGSVLTDVSHPDGRAESFGYGAGGELTSITETGVDGITTRTWDYVWSGSELAEIQRPDGTALRFTYGDANHPDYVTRMTLVGTDASERIEAAFDYDLQGNVIASWKGAASSSDPGAVELWQFEFDNPALPTQTTVTDPLGNTALYVYERDPVSRKPRLTQVSDDCPSCGLGPNTQRFYEDPQNPLRVTREIDAESTVTLFTYDARGRRTSRVEAFGTPLERETTWQYDANFPALVTETTRPSTTGNPLDLRRSSSTYDPATGVELSRSIEGFEDGAPFLYTTSMTYNAAGQRTAVDPPGYGTADVTSWSYDPARGDLLPTSRTDPLIGTTTLGYDAFNRQNSVTDPNGVTTETVYDALGRVRFTIQRGATPAEDLVTEHRYSVFGDLFQQILPRGNVIEYLYDAAGRLVSIERKPDPAPTSHGERTLFTLDAFGHRVREELQRWDGAGWVTESRTDYAYSTRCHLDQVIRGAGSATPSVTEYAYGCDGELEQIWDANHPSLGQTQPATTIYNHDELDRVTSVTQPWGGAGGGNVVTTYGYDPQDHLTQVTDAEGGITSYEWSDRDLLTREESEVSGVSTYAFNEHGEMVEKTDARAITAAYTLDALDRVTFEDYPGTDLDVTRVYDDPMVPFSLGRLTGIERDGHTIGYVYDRFGRILRDGDLEYALDENGNRQEIRYPGGVIARYTHDASDREASLELEVPGEPLRQVVTAASYEPFGPLASLALGNGLGETRDYDSRYFPESIALAGGGPLLDWQYTVDAEGNPTAIADVLSPAQSRVYAYQDFQYYLTQGKGPWGNLAWTYDQIGNRLSETRDGTTDTYSYVANAAAGNSAQLSQIQLGGGGTQSYVFDAAGNQIQVSDGAAVTDMTYDEAGRLAAIERPAADVRSEFLYDGRSYLRHAEELMPAQIFADGFESGDAGCWSAAVGGPAGGACPEAPRVAPTYSSEGILHHQSKENGLERYVIYFAGRPVLLVSRPQAGASEYLYITTDHLGTPILASNTVASVAWSGGFEPFGGDFSNAGPSGVYLRFPGQWDDRAWLAAPHAEEHYFNVHRWYLANRGAYGRSDPLGLWAQINLYLYATANPITKIDPLGLRSILYDGCKVFFIDDSGAVEKSCNATSGKPGTGTGDQAKPYEGPIPEGLYTLDPEECSGGPVRSIPRRLFFGDWGTYRVPLHPTSDTDTKDRDGFFMHGGKRPGSAGCIDVGPCDTFLCKWANRRPKDKITVKVNYGPSGVCN